MNLYEHVVLDNQKNLVNMSIYKGKLLLIVNTATGCMFTPQYKGLEELYEKYKDQGFVILDFPCNQFFGQAPGNNEVINTFCELRYHTTFPRFNKIDVNGGHEEPLFAFLKLDPKKNKSVRVKWNFTKFLVSRDGKVIERFGPAFKPEKIEEYIVKNL